MKGTVVSEKSKNRARTAAAGALIATFAITATGCAASLHPVQLPRGGGTVTTQ